MAVAAAVDKVSFERDYCGNVAGVLLPFYSHYTEQPPVRTGEFCMNEILLLTYSCLQCFDAVGWAAGRASGL